MAVSNSAKSPAAPRFTAAEAKRFVADARKDGIAISESRELRQRLEAHPDSFAPAARKVLTAFFSEESSHRVRSQPVAIQDGHGKVADPAGVFGESITYAQVQGQAFIDGASPNDIEQGQVGDCFLLATLASIAAQQPELLEKNLTDHHDGTFTVRLFQPGAEGTFQPVDVKVDSDLVTRNSGLVYAHGTNVKELWPALYEKAYAQQFGASGYASIDRGGLPSEAMERLTGKRALRWTMGSVLASQSSDALFDTLRQGLANGDLATASTYQPRTKEAAAYPGAGLVAAHAYTLLDVGEAHGKKYVELRNPWAVVESGHDRKADGVFRMPFDEFCRRFQYLDCSV